MDYSYYHPLITVHLFFFSFSLMTLSSECPLCFSSLACLVCDPIWVECSNPVFYFSPISCIVTSVTVTFFVFVPVSSNSNLSCLDYRALSDSNPVREFDPTLVLYFSNREQLPCFDFFCQVAFLRPSCIHSHLASSSHLPLHSTQHTYKSTVVILHLHLAITLLHFFLHVADLFLSYI